MAEGGPPAEESESRDYSRHAGDGAGFEASSGGVGGAGVGEEPGLVGGAEGRGVSWPCRGLLGPKGALGVLLRLLCFCAAFMCWACLVHTPFCARLPG